MKLGKSNRARGFGSRREKPVAVKVDAVRTVPDPKEDRDVAWQWVDAGLVSEIPTP